MSMRTAILLVILIACADCAVAQRTFTKRVGFNIRGQITMIGNVNVRGHTWAWWNSPAGNTTTDGNNDSYYMRHVDVDADGSTFNSSSAYLGLPVSSDSVLWAGLYWQGYSQQGYTQSGVDANAYVNRFKVRIRKDAGAYTELTAAQQDDITTYNYNGWYAYQGYYDITALVTTGGSGWYYVANVVVPNNERGVSCGWSIVVLYKHAAAGPVKNMVIWDGYRAIQPSSSETITLHGFKTPATGAVNTRVGTVAFEGDAGLLNDRLRLGPSTYISDAANPSTNFFNSSISADGVRFSDKNPDFTNQLGYDIDLVNTSGVLGNSLTSTSIEFSTSGDLYYPGVMSFETESHAPAVTVQKLFYDAGSNSYSATHLIGIPPNTISNRTVQYHFAFENIADESALNVLLADTIPPLQSYVAGSMQISMDGVNWTALTDATDSDAGYFDASNDRVLIGIGNGATSSTGGQLLAFSVRYARFQTLVDDPATFPGPLPGMFEAPNFALVTYSDTAASTFDANSNGVMLIIDNALPVELVAFSARAVGRDARLTWRTATEANNAGFEIERRGSGSGWERIGFVDGHGSSNTPQTYSYTDTDAARFGTQISYRLRQMDRDGGAEYTPAVSIAFAAPAALTISSVYPHPVSAATPAAACFTVPNGEEYSLALYTIQGKEMSILAAGPGDGGTYMCSIETGELRPGTYLLVLSSGMRQTTRLFSVTR